MTPAGKNLRFGPFDFDPERQQLRKLGSNIHLVAPQHRLLNLFLARPGEIVTRDQMMHWIWPEVTDADLAIQSLQIILGDDPSHPVYLEAVDPIGFRFIASISTIPSAHTLPSPSTYAPKPAPFTRETGFFDAAAMLNFQSDPLLTASMSRSSPPVERSFTPTRSRIVWFVLITLVLLCFLVVGLSRHLQIAR